MAQHPPEPDAAGEEAMRSVCGVLTALVVSGSIFTASAETRTTDEKTDVARVEQELRVIAEAAAVRNRARKRARKAVEMSSLGRKLQHVEREWEEFERGEKIEEPASRLREKRIIYREKIGILVKRMTRLFLKYEVAKAARKKLPILKRELEKISRQYAEI